MNKLQELHTLVYRRTLLVVPYVVMLANLGLFVISLTLQLGVDICKDFYEILTINFINKHTITT